MRRAASRGRSLLPDPARTIAFLADQVNDDGGFADRAGRSDLYYTVFGLEALTALDQPPPPNGPSFLRSFLTPPSPRGEGRGEGTTVSRAVPGPGDVPVPGSFDRLDFVHLNCLARCWGSYPADAPDPATRRRMLARIETFRTPDGGYSQWPGATTGSAYGCILALGAYQDLAEDAGTSADQDAGTPGHRDAGKEGIANCKLQIANYKLEGTSLPTRLAATRSPVGAQGSVATAPTLALPPRPEALLACLRTLKTADGGYINEPGQSAGLTPATAAAVTVQAELGGTGAAGLPARGAIDAQAIDWLLARHLPTGGFAAMPALPLADLLSTATALHALARAGVNLDPIRETCLTFVRSMSADGAFTGHAFDDIRDCEYTFYGLLALGQLATENVP